MTNTTDVAPHSGAHYNSFIGAGAQAVVRRMGEAVAGFLVGLSMDQKHKAVIPFADQLERTNWHYTPILRKGLSLSEMTFPQRQKALQLVKTGLSRGGFVTTSTVMGLENTLDLLEDWQRTHPGRDPQLYYLSVFGAPDEKGLWGWRFEGHHISLNFTIADGKIIAPTPMFFGSNPADAPFSPTATLRPLAGVEDLARELVHSFDEEALSNARISPAAPPDNVLYNLPDVSELRAAVGRDFEGILQMPAHSPDLEAWKNAHGLSDAHVRALHYSETPGGLSHSRMNSGQRELLLALISEYIHRMPDELAEIEWRALRARGLDGIHFAWAGGLEKRQGHYYRIQGPRFLCEYDNTQNDANHIHSVWRDPANDFGRNLLANHYAHHH